MLLAFFPHMSEKQESAGDRKARKSGDKSPHSKLGQPPGRNKDNRPSVGPWLAFLDRELRRDAPVFSGRHLLSVVRSMEKAAMD
jgi:hypothetical protein